MYRALYMDALFAMAPPMISPRVTNAPRQTQRSRLPNGNPNPASDRPKTATLQYLLLQRRLFSCNACRHVCGKEVLSLQLASTWARTQGIQRVNPKLRRDFASLPNRQCPLLHGADKGERVRLLQHLTRPFSLGFGFRSNPSTQQKTEPNSQMARTSVLA